MKVELVHPLGVLDLEYLIGLGLGILSLEGPATGSSTSEAGGFDSSLTSGGDVVSSSIAEAFPEEIRDISAASHSVAL